MSENIPSTKIGTSEPLNICSGIGYFPGPGDPSGQTHRGYPTGIQPDWELWDIRAKLWWGGSDNDFVTKATARIEAGICGPNYAIKSTFHGTADDEGLELSVESDQISAGFFFGIGIFFTPSISVFGVSVPLPGATIDVIQELATLLGMKSPQGSFFDRVGEFTPSLMRTTGYSMFDANQNAFGANGGKYKASPTFNIALDLVGYTNLTYIAQAIDNFLRPLGFQSRMVFGPLLGIQLPVSVEVESVEIGGARYSDITYTKETHKLTAGAPSGQFPASPNNLKVFFKHTPSLTFSLGVSWGFGIDKIFFIGGQLSFPVGQWFGLALQLGTWRNPLQNQVGNTTLPNLAAYESGDHADYAEVIFEPAGSMA